jgi:thioredoxin 1
MLSNRKMETRWPSSELTKDNFEQVGDLQRHRRRRLLGAVVRAPAAGFAPVFEKVAEKNPDIIFAKVNTDEEQEIAQHFQIRSIPTLMVFRDQIIVFSQARRAAAGRVRAGDREGEGPSTWKRSSARSHRAKSAAPPPPA